MDQISVGLNDVILVSARLGKLFEDHSKTFPFLFEFSIKIKSYVLSLRISQLQVQ